MPLLRSWNRGNSAALPEENSVTRATAAKHARALTFAFGHNLGKIGNRREFLKQRLQQGQVLAEVELEALPEERANSLFVIDVALELGFRGRAFVGFARKFEELTYPNCQLVLGERLHNSVRLTAQRKRIFRTCGLQSQRKHTRDRICFVGD